MAIKAHYIHQQSIHSNTSNKLQILFIMMYDKPRQTPFKTTQYNSLQYSKQNVIKQLELVFTYYCGKGSKYNYQELQEKYFMEMAIQLFGLAGKKDEFSRMGKKWVRVSTLYYTKGRSKPLYLSQFLQLLPGLAKCIFMDEMSSPSKKYQVEMEEEKGMKNILLQFQKLYHHILEEELYKKGLKSQQIKEDTKQFLIKLKDSLTKIYKVYFEGELTLKDRQREYYHKSFQGLLQMMKDFEVYPKLISASQLFFIFKQVTNDRQHNNITLLSPSMNSKTSFPKIGQFFTLTKFAQSLILASHICVGKLKRVEGEEMIFSKLGMSQKEAVKLLLEYMETMRSVKQKYCKFTKQRFSLIVYEQYSDYTSQYESHAHSSPSKSVQNKTLGDSKKSFFNILNKIQF